MNSLDSQIIAYYNTPGSARGIYKTDSLVFLADWDCGLQIYEHYQTHVREDFLTKPYRNSEYFAPTIICRNMLLPKNVDYKIFDITGRTIIPSNVKPGIYFIEINGQLRHKIIKIR